MREPLTRWVARHGYEWRPVGRITRRSGVTAKRNFSSTAVVRGVNVRSLQALTVNALNASLLARP